MVTLALVALGGSAGALARFGCTHLIAHWGRPAFWATLGINLVGCLALGALAGAVQGSGQQHGTWSRWWALLAVGFLGAFTTFSTFGLEVATMLREGRPWLAIGYLLASAVLGVALAGAGYWGAAAFASGWAPPPAR